MSAFLFFAVMFIGVPFCAGMLGGALVLWLGRPDA